MAANDINQRPNYFAGQYLLEDDFELEQNYQKDRQQRHNCLLHVSGVAEGLKVTSAQEGGLKVKVSPGTAVDKQGRQIILLNERTVDLPGKGEHTLFIRYAEKKDSPQVGTTEAYRRIVEESEINVNSSESSIALAKLTVADDKITKIDESVRQYSGLRLPGPENSEVTLRSAGDRDRIKAILSGGLSVQGDLSVTGKVSVTDSATAGNKTVDGNVSIGKAKSESKLTVVGTATVSDGSHFATENGKMASGSLTIGSMEKSYGGQTKKWEDMENRPEGTAGLLLETKANTEIAIHDSNTRVASMMYYEGDDKNSITIGRDMGWGAIQTLALNGNVGIGTTSPQERLHVNGRIKDKTGWLMPVGSILPYAGSSAPEGWYICDGTAKDINGHKELYEVIGTTYGGSGNNFNLPNLKGRVPVGLSEEEEFNSLGKTAGSKTHKLTIDEMPEHHHEVKDPGHSHQIKPGDEVGEGKCDDAKGGGRKDAGTELAYTGITIQDTGRSQAHNNLPPYITINYIIKY